MKYGHMKGGYCNLIWNCAKMATEIVGSWNRAWWDRGWGEYVDCQLARLHRSVFHSQARTMKREARFTTSRARANVCKIARNMKRELYPQPESLHDNHAATATNNNHHRHFQHAAWPPTWLSHMPHAGAKCTTMVPQTASNPPPTVLHQLQHQRRFDIRACYI